MSVRCIIPHKLAQRRSIRTLAASAAITALAMSGLTGASPALAQSSVRTGTINNVFVSDGTYYGFRVFLTQSGTNPLADCSSSFAYVNTTNNNYQAFVAELTTLYVRGTPVNLVVSKDSNGFCQILEFGT